MSNLLSPEEWQRLVGSRQVSSQTVAAIRQRAAMAGQRMGLPPQATVNLAEIMSSPAMLQMARMTPPQAQQPPARPVPVQAVRPQQPQMRTRPMSYVDRVLAERRSRLSQSNSGGAPTPEQQALYGIMTKATVVPKGTFAIPSQSPNVVPFARIEKALPEGWKQEYGYDNPETQGIPFLIDRTQLNDKEDTYLATMLDKIAKERELEAAKAILQQHKGK